MKPMLMLIMIIIMINDANYVDNYNNGDDYDVNDACLLLSLCTSDFSLL
jgi:hypothetical protein